MSHNLQWNNISNISKQEHYDSFIDKIKDEKK
jgi:hypothetical protein